MGNSNENLCSCNEENNRVSLSMNNHYFKEKYLNGANTPKNNIYSTDQNHDLGDNCWFLSENQRKFHAYPEENYDKISNYKPEIALKRQITFGAEQQDNNNQPKEINEKDQKEEIPKQNFNISNKVLKSFYFHIIYLLIFTKRP